MSGAIRIHREEAIGWIIFDHAERRNAISIDMWRAIPQVATALDQDAAIRAIVLRGAGDSAFVSGADISEFESARTAETAQAYEADKQGATAALESIGKPVIAMIHGTCVGGGVGLALAADIRYCADDARFCVPPVRLGLGYSARSVAALAQAVGIANAKELLYTAKRIGAEEAEAMGLVNAVLPKEDLEDHVRHTANEIAANAPLTLRAIKLAAGELAHDAGLRDQQAIDTSIRACFESEDYQEGVRAFLEKRRPRFKGR